MVHENQFADRIKVVYEKTSPTLSQDERDVRGGNLFFCIIFSEALGSENQ